MVQTHRCPATVSGTKSAETTEVFGLGKVQRVGTCREPGDLPYIALRRPFEGKGRQRVGADPDRSRLGFFLRAASRPVWNRPPSPHVGEEEDKGKHAVVPPAALPPLLLSALVDTARNALHHVLRVPTRRLRRARGWCGIWARPHAYPGPWPRLGIAAGGLQCLPLPVRE